MVALTNTQVIIDSLAGIWTSRPPASTSEFVEANVRLNDSVEANSGRYDLAENPFWNEILDAVHDPFVESIASLKSTQIGGTLANIVAAMATSVIDPAPSMFVVPTRDDGRLLRDRIYGNAAKSEPILAKKVPPARLRNMISVDLESMHIYLAWPGSKQRMRGKPCKYVWLSEIDVYEFDDAAGDPNNAAERRTDRFPESTIIRESTPVGDDSTIANYFEAGDQRRWFCKCPHCGHRQALKFFVAKSGKHKGCGGIVGYLDKKRNHLDQVTARKQAHYVCEKGCRIDQPHKAAFIRSGVWVPLGCKVNKRGKITGKPLKSPRYRSYHLWQIMNPSKTFGDLAATYIHHVDEGNLREFVQDVLGLRYRTAKKMPTWHVLGKRLAWPNTRGIVPVHAWFLTCGCDVQTDRVVWSVRGWAPRRTSWLVDWGEFMRTEVQVDDDDADIALTAASDLVQIDELLDRVYPIAGDLENPLGRKRLPIRLVGIDSNFRTADVHEYCLWHPEAKRLRALRGDHHVSARERYRMTEVARDPITGERIDDENRRLQIWGVQVDYYKQLLTERLQSTPATGFPGNKNPDVHDGGFYVTADCLENGQKYLKQLVNEPPTIVVDPRTGRKKTVFKPRSKNIGVDFWDTTVYSEVLADMVVGRMGWSLAAWKRWIESMKPKRNRGSSRTLLER